MARVRDPERVRRQESEWRARNPELVRAAKQRWYRQNAERITAENLARYYANPEPALRKQREYYEANRELISERTRQYRKANRAKCLAWDAKYRGLKKAATIEVFAPEEIFERDGWVCGICTNPIDPEVQYPDHQCASVDHVVPLSRGGEHSRANAQASHLTCNKRKHARM